MDTTAINLPIAVTAALVASASFALASVLQHRAAHREQSDRMVSASLVVTLMRRPLWLLGGVGIVVGVALQALASHYGPLTLIQCILIGNLVFTVPLGAVLERRQMDGHDLSGVILCGIGVIGFLLLTRPKEGSSQITGLHGAELGAVVIVATGLCLAVAHRTSGDRQAALLGVAAGVIVGCIDALIKTCADLAAGSLSHLLTSWPLYALAALGGIAIVLEQNALRAGRLTASISAMTVLEPIVGITIGVVAFNETIVSGALLLPELLAAAAAIGGIVRLSARNVEWEQPEPVG